MISLLLLKLRGFFTKYLGFVFAIVISIISMKLFFKKNLEIEKEKEKAERAKEEFELKIKKFEATSKQTQKVIQDANKINSDNSMRDSSDINKRLLDKWSRD